MMRLERRSGAEHQGEGMMVMNPRRSDEQTTLPELGGVIDSAGRDFMRQLFVMHDHWGAMAEALRAANHERAIAIASAMLTTRRLLGSSYHDLAVGSREVQQREQFARHALAANERGLRLLLRGELFQVTRGSRLHEALITFNALLAAEPMDGMAGPRSERALPGG